MRIHLFVDGLHTLPPTACTATSPLQVIRAHTHTYAHTAASSFTALNSLRKPFVARRCRDDVPGSGE